MHRDADAADEMPTLLCDLLRDSLDADGVQEVPLRHEMRVLERYLGIMRLRFPDRLAVDVRVDHDVLDEPVPHFILQPLAENAIEHGIARAGGRLRITVADDGPAPPAGRPRCAMRQASPARASGCGSCMGPRPRCACAARRRGWRSS